MKKIITLLILIVCLQVKAQFVTIPDANFVTWLQTIVPSAMTGNQMDTTSLAVTTLTYLNVENLGITDLTGLQYFDSLSALDCGNSQFSSNSNTLTSLPNLPASLTELICSNNQLSDLPILPNSLTRLYCSYNQLTTLPILSNSLLSIKCSHNQLTSFPVLSNSLLFIDCSYNQLISLPSLPISLGTLYCSNNQLTSLPLLPVGLWALSCSHNNISCFPVFPNIPSHYIDTPDIPILAFDIDYNPFSCLPNYVGGMNNANLNYPLCMAGNINGCPDANGISGFTYYDDNINCTKDAGDTWLKNIPLKIYDNSGVFLSRTYSALNGVYQFPQISNTYTVAIDTAGLPLTASCVYPGLDSTVTVISLDTNINFGFTCKPGFDIGVQSINRKGIVFPGNTHTLSLVAGDISHWNNLNCSSGISGTFSFSVNGPVTFIGPASGSLIPNVSGNIYTYNIADFGTINNTTDFNLIFQTDVIAQSGDAICVNATITPINGDNDPTNNTYQFCYIVRNSQDPNFKEVYPVSVSPGFNDWLTYTIHFQNNGLAAAINIRLQDSLDAKLDPETFQLINYSHNNVVDLTGKNLTVRFPNIQLASFIFNPSYSKGFIQYRIKPKADWATDTIKNKASIYFDYNAPIVTKTAKSYFMASTTINELMIINNDVNVLPNPGNGLITVNSRYDMQKIEVINIAGQLLFSEQTTEKSHQLQLQNFAEGIYFIKVIYANGLSVTKKIVVNR